MKHEIYYNDKVGKYTLKQNIDGHPSIKKKPLKYKPSDSTAKYRKDILREKLLSSK